MKVFAKAMNTEGEKGNLLGVITLTFFLGVTLSLTEFLCTGQIYGGIILGISHFKEAYAYFALISYNFMFVLDNKDIRLKQLCVSNIISLFDLDTFPIFSFFMT